MRHLLVGTGVTVREPVHVDAERKGAPCVETELARGPMATCYAPVPGTIPPGADGQILLALYDPDYDWDLDWVLVWWADYGFVWHRAAELERGP